MNLFYNQPSPPATRTASVTYSPSNEQAAWFAIAYTAATIHGYISEEAREALCKMLASKQMYRGHELVDYFKEVWKVRDQVSPKEIIRQAAKRINQEHAPTLFCIITDILLTKGYLTKQEENLLDYISVMLSLDTKTTNTILEVLLTKNKGNYIEW